MPESTPLGILGSTSYAYLSREQRTSGAGGKGAASIPMMVGVGAIATNEVLRLVEDAWWRKVCHR